MNPSPVAYNVSLGIAAAGCAGFCVAARLRPGPWVLTAARSLGVLLAAEAASRLIAPAVQGRFSVHDDLPLFLCDLVAWIAPAAFWWQSPLLYELTYFWGLAGGIQGVLTPTVKAPFPRLGFMQYVVAHNGVVVAALITVIALRFVPRERAVSRMFVLACGYTALVGIVDATTGANYMYLRAPPPESTLLDVLGPWPWYVLSGAAIGLLLFVVLDLPFRRRRRTMQRYGDVDKQVHIT